LIIKDADVAQLVEQPIRNRQVSGSSPLVGSIFSITYGHSSLSARLSVTWFVTQISPIDGVANRIQHRMLVPHGCTHIRVAHDIYTRLDTSSSSTSRVRTSIRQRRIAASVREGFLNSRGVNFLFAVIRA
jgi:hypothetical protein